MDKVKLALTQLKKHHFWVLCGLIVVTALLSWAQATGDLAGQTEKRIKALEGEFATVQNVNLQPNHPNETVIKAIREAIDGASDKPGVKHNVLRAWTILYDEQKNKNALPDVLGKRFKEHFENLPPNGELDPDDLDTYMYQIEKYFPKLFRMIDLRRRKDTSLDVVLNQPTPKDQHNTGEKAERVDMVGTVEWDRANLDPLLKRFHWIGRPETKDVRLAQEDLWVYESLLRIIKDTNEGTTYDTAAIRKIEALEIGREAVESWLKRKIPCSTPARHRSAQARPPARHLAGIRACPRWWDRIPEAVPAGRPLCRRQGEAPLRRDQAALCRVQDDAHQSPPGDSPEEDHQVVGPLRQFQHADPGSHRATPAG